MIIFIDEETLTLEELEREQHIKLDQELNLEEQFSRWGEEILLK